MANKFMTHSNGNLLCAIDIETTGPNPFEHEIYQICILPLDSDLKHFKEITPFYMDMKVDPSRPREKGWCRDDKIAKSITRGVDPNIAATILMEWFEKRLKIDVNKKILSLTSDWGFVKSFLLQWLGYHQTNMMFHEYHRDLIANACYANDSAYFNIEQIPYPKCHFSYICSQLKVTIESRGDTLSQAVAIAECHRQMLRKLF